MEIKIGKIGKITSGEESGSYVKVLDDSANTGGFLILTSTLPNMQNGFNNWVENKEMLQSYFEESGWFVEWPN